jgi:hypothetical protein
VGLGIGGSGADASSVVVPLARSALAQGLDRPPLPQPRSQLLMMLSSRPTRWSRNRAWLDKALRYLGLLEEKQASVQQTVSAFRSPSRGAERELVVAESAKADALAQVAFVLPDFVSSSLLHFHL